MSKVKYTVDIEEYICDVLEDMRKMTKTGDYSRLPAAIEHLQHHAYKMENAIYASSEAKRRIEHCVDDDDLGDWDFREKVREILKKDP